MPSPLRQAIKYADRHEIALAKAGTLSTVTAEGFDLYSSGNFLLCSIAPISAEGPTFLVVCDKALGNRLSDGCSKKAGVRHEMQHSRFGSADTMCNTSDNSTHRFKLAFDGQSPQATQR